MPAGHCSRWAGSVAWDSPNPTRMMASLSLSHRVSGTVPVTVTLRVSARDSDLHTARDAGVPRQVPRAESRAESGRPRRPRRLSLGSESEAQQWPLTGFRRDSDCRRARVIMIRGRGRGK